MADACGGGKTIPFGHQEPIGRDTQSGVMMKATPTTSFVVTQTEFLLKFLVVPLDDPAMFGQVHQLNQRGIRRQGGQPVLDGLFFIGRPFDQ